MLFRGARLRPREALQGVRRGLATELLLSVNRADPRPIQVQLFESIRTLILNASLKAGQRLPSSRDLAGELSLSRNTVALAYERLAAEGYVKMKARAGTYVSEKIPD